MQQSKVDSALEAFSNVFIGSLVALLTQLIWFPLIGKDFTLYENLLTTACFTVVALCRSYLLRRLFNGKSIYSKIKEWLRFEHSQNI